MTEWIRHAALAGGDLLFGWLMRLPGDLVLTLLALGSALLLVAVRRAATNQELLRRCAADKKRLRQLLREARKRGDREAVARLRANRSRVSLKQFRAEMLPLACLILPVAFLANWAWHRLEFHPPRPGEMIELRATFPAAAVGDLAHLVPQEHLSAARGWIQPIESATVGRNAPGVARWAVSFGESSANAPLVVRHRQRTLEWAWKFDRTMWETPVKEFEDAAVRMEVRLRPVKLFGVVPGVRWLGLPPWLVGYLLLTALCTALLKRWWRVS